jgi:hypothetical protein
MTAFVVCPTCGQPMPEQALQVGAKRHPIKEVLTRYDALFHARYGVRPDIGAKDATLAGQLISRHGEAEVMHRLEQFFVCDDPFFLTAGHTFPVFRSCWNKLLVLAAEPRVDYVSEVSKQNISNAEAALRLVASRQKTIAGDF